MKTRNNARRMKKSLQKVLLKTNEVERIKKKKHLKAQEKKNKQQKILEEKIKRQSILDSIDEMSYNDLRKLASDAGISIYQRKKEQIKQDLKDYYEQLWSESH
jgi:tRNA U34 2-thiouridine synthase MnmA/TrmU